MNSSSAESMELCFPQDQSGVLPFRGRSNPLGLQARPPSPTPKPRRSAPLCVVSNPNMANDDSTSSITWNDETRFMDRALEAWRWWGHGVGPREPVSFGKLLRISGEDVRSRLLYLSDEQFERIDREVARLDGYSKHLLEVEYLWGGTDEQKGRGGFSLGRSAYRDLRFAVLSQIYGSLMPDVEDWRIAVEIAESSVGR